jgi:lysophospholipase L1-like esterase
VGFPAGFTVPCEVKGRPGACDNPDFSRRFFPPGLARSGTPFAVPLEKGARAFRVVVLGESAAQGDPAPPHGFARFLEAMLREAWPGVAIEVVNAGVVAIDSHVMLPIARDLAALAPDVVVIYAGHNEVVGPYGPGAVPTGGQPGLATIRAAVTLSSSRLGQLLAAAMRPSGAGGERRGMGPFLERQVRASDPRLEAVSQAFRRNLADAVAAARGAGARVVVSTVATRLAGFAPLGSLHRGGLGSDALAAWQARVEAGDRLAAAGRCSSASARWPPGTPPRPAPGSPAPATSTRSASAPTRGSS